ncbi:YeiH family protein [Oerskovia flava]|uniref:YeiH family protein n=1 Tax=Oerskovia flava TaxID=2986422 RepID=UPI0022402033|nr:putative sulfate exporter family transporter [Oerskovia sp. JB1-3-2]
MTPPPGTLVRTAAPARAAAAPSRRGTPAGIALCVLATVGVLLAARLLPGVSPLVIALVAGSVVGSVRGASTRSSAGRPRGTARPGAAPLDAGARWVATHVLRAGVVLLGLQLSVPQVLGLGWRGLTVVAVTVAVTFGATCAVGRWLRLPRATVLLVATGFSVCGAAAISAMRGVLDRREPDDASPAATALALVTVYGSLAIVVLPWLAGLVGLDAEQTGLWIGASVQEVAQVVTAAGTVSAVALATATVSKLARVVLLAPIVTVAGFAAARSARADTETGPVARRVSPVPLFVVGFLAAVVVASLGVVPAGWVEASATVTTVLFTAAMFAMGLGVDVPHLVRTGRRALVLGAASAVVVSGVSLGAVLLLTG